MSELKPCPFCGSSNTTLDYYEISCPQELGTIVVCNDCGASATSIVDWNTRPIEDALNARIAECESALISMVQQFFYNKDGEDAFRHAFMSAEEEAATYLVEHGIACWTDDYKSAIRFIGA